MLYFLYFMLNRRKFIQSLSLGVTGAITFCNSSCADYEDYAFFNVYEVDNPEVFQSRILGHIREGCHWDCYGDDIVLLNSLVYNNQKFCNNGDLRDVSQLELNLVNHANLDDFCSDGAQGCYSSSNDRITFARDMSILYSINVGYHEVGHFMRENSKEYMSIANELYGAFKLHQLFPMIGPYALRSGFGKIGFEQRDGDYGRSFDDGLIFSVANVLNNGGDFDQAFSTVLNASIDHMDFVVDLNREQGVNQLHSVYLTWDNILFRSDFKDFLTSSTHYMNEEDADELIMFLDVLNQVFNGCYDVGDVEHYSGVVDSLKSNFVRIVRNPSMIDVVENYI